MTFPPYLAMTAAEFSLCRDLPPKIAWMACHFSPYGTGLSNCPTQLPAGSMIILNDRTSIHGHDPQLISRQLSQMEVALQPGCFLLDFQRPGCALTAEVVKAAVASLKSPVGVSDLYAQGVDCPVFLPPVPPECPVEAYLAPWQGREIWLEAALDGCTLTVTEDGCAAAPLPTGEAPACPFTDESLHCRYRVDIGERQLRFTLRRTEAELSALLHQAATLGVTQAVGLFQELSR